MNLGVPCFSGKRREVNAAQQPPWEDTIAGRSKRNHVRGVYFFHLYLIWRSLNWIFGLASTYEGGRVLTMRRPNFFSRKVQWSSYSRFPRPVNVVLSKGQFVKFKGIAISNKTWKTHRTLQLLKHWLLGGICWWSENSEPNIRKQYVSPK